jgi:hypothetical protein
MLNVIKRQIFHISFVESTSKETKRDMNINVGLFGSGITRKCKREKERTRVENVIKVHCIYL